MERKKWLIPIGIYITLCSIVGLVATESLAASGTYKILAWNDLGMHCYSRDFADLAVLPPYNTLWVQVVKAGDPPQLVTSGITVEYSYPDNTYSVGKTNFWAYDQALFGVDLPANVGLKGKGLSGTMDLSGDHFVAEGIPITEFSDSAPTVRQPYQLANVVVKDSATGAVLTSTQVVTPTSSEMRCDNCHSDTGIAKPSTLTGKVETNILQLHDENTGTTLMTSRPVLCASCHASNALGAPGKPGLNNLSKSMHTQHAGVIPSTLAGCYNCHPGPQTRCLRDVMSTEEGMICSSCHGSMANVSNNPNPWLNEPRCDGCHNSGRYNQNQALYRFSQGHGGLYCEACHDSTHAIAPSRESNDAIKFIQLQGSNGPIEECLVCHTVIPPAGGPHVLNPTISGNAGVGGVTLSYTDGSVKTVLADASGNYTLVVPPGWSGTVTPLRACYTFTPVNRKYSNLQANQTGQNYSAVFNSGCGVSAGTYNDTDPNWTYIGNWLSYSGSGPYNSTLRYTTNVGNMAWFPFNGTQFVLSYTQNTNRGNFEVYVDGNKIATVNANGTLQWQKIYASPVFPTGLHVVQTKNIGGGGKVIDIDAIQIFNGAIPGAGIYDDNVNWSYSGTWLTYSGVGPYGSTLHYTGKAGNMAMFTFTGTQFILSYTQNTNRGSFEVYVDGGKIATLNANGALQWQKTFTSPIFAVGAHVVQVKNIGGSGNIIDVDAIEILDTPIPGANKYDDNNNWFYSSKWLTYSGSGPYGSTLHYTNAVGNWASFTFSGTQFILSYTQNINRGSFEIYVDGTKIATINANGTLQWQKTFTSPLLVSDTHVVQVKNIGGGGSITDVDAIEILDTPIPGAGTYDDNDNWFYSGKWLNYSGSGPYTNSLHYTSVIGNIARFIFNGTQFTLSYTQNTNRGSFEVYVDGSKIATINANGTLQWQKTYSSPTFSAGTHVVQVKNIGGSGNIIDVDAIQIVP